MILRQNNLIISKKSPNVTNFEIIDKFSIKLTKEMTKSMKSRQPNYVDTEPVLWAPHRTQKARPSDSPRIEIRSRTSEDFM